MFVRLVFGLFVLKAAVASPRFSRQVDLDTYDNANYDVENEENEDNEYNYDYDDGLTTDDPQIEIETLVPDYNYPAPEEEEEAQVEEGEEEQEQEEGQEEEQPLKPQLIPQGSGGSGVLMGPDTQKGLKQHTEAKLKTVFNE